MALRFSIIVPTHGRPDSLKRCLQSLQALNHPAENFEILVVHDGNEHSLVSDLSDLRFTQAFRIFSQSWGGPGKARNTGARAAAGQYLAFLDDDCCADAEWLNELEKALADHPRSLTGGRTINHLPDNLYSAASQLLVDMIYATYNRDPENSWFFTSNNIAISRELYLDSGGFYEEYCSCAEDREYCNRLRSLGHRLVYAPGAIIRHAHALNLRSYWRQHFRYGRGAAQFHKQRIARNSSTLWEEAGLHRNVSQWWKRPWERGRNFREKISLMILLGMSQVANALGALISLTPLSSRVKGWKD